MTAKKGTPAHPRSSFYVGRRVRFQLGLGTIEGVITEDRGFLGVGGRRLWTVEVNLPDYYGIVELPEVDMQPVD